MTETILRSLTRLSEAGDDAILPGEMAAGFGERVLNRLIAKRVVIENAPLCFWDACDQCDCAPASRPITAAGDVFRAECPLEARQDVVLTADDLRVFRIDASALAREICAAGGWNEEPSLVAPKIWRLGDTAFGRAVFLVLERATLTGEGVVPLLHRAAGTAKVTLLTPRLAGDLLMRYQDAGFHVVETPSVLTLNSSGHETIDAFVLEPEPEEPLLRVRTAAAEVHWAGHSIVLSHQMFSIFKRLVDAARSRDPVASGPHIEAATGREARDLIRELRKALKNAGLVNASGESLIETVRNRGYRLCVTGSRIVFED